MQSWRKILAIILVIVFAPATVLAAMPLKLCLGNDGHRAIEGIFALDHHLDAAHSKPDVEARAVDHSQTSDFVNGVPDCRDVALQAVAQVSSRTSVSDDHSNATKVFGADLPTFPQLIAVTSLCDSGEQGHPAKGVQHDPHLASLATIVLLN